MNKIIKIIFLSLAMITLLTAPALGALTEAELLQTAEKYAKASEKTAVYGPYTNQNKSYYFAEYRTGNTLTGVLILEMDAGKVVSDEKTLRQMLFTVYYLMGTNNSSPALSNQSAQQYKAAALKYENNKDAAALFNKIAETYEEIETVEKSVVVNVSRSHENALKLSQLHKDLSGSLKSLDAAYENSMAANAGLTKEDIAKLMEDIETRQQNAQALEDQGVKLSNERTDIEGIKKAPGFGLFAAVFALSVIGFFVRKQKK